MSHSAQTERHSKAMGRLFAALSVLYALLCGLLLYPSISSSGAEERYACTWESGETEESFGELFPYIEGMDASGNVRLLRDGVAGTAGSGLASAAQTLLTGSAAEIFSLNCLGASAAERVAFYRCMRGVLLYSDGIYGWRGESFVPADVFRAKTFVWLDGGSFAGLLSATHATELLLRGEAEFFADALTGSYVERMAAQPPYAAEGGAVLLSATGGRRLVGALPHVVSLRVEDIAFADEGALLPCERLEALDLPFVGNSAAGVGSLYEGMLAHLFRRGDDYYVPATLSTLRVRGGTLVSHAFYRCRTLTKIDACGVDAARIERDAFADCTALVRLHSPREDVSLSGNFRKTKLDCGCTLFERV